MTTTNRHGKSKYVVVTVINKIAKLKKVNITKLAFALGYNLHYFRYTIIPTVLEVSQCVTLEGNELVWVCDDASIQGGGEG